MPPVKGSSAAAPVVPSAPGELPKLTEVHPPYAAALAKANELGGGVELCQRQRELDKVRAEWEQFRFATAPKSPAESGADAILAGHGIPQADWQQRLTAYQRRMEELQYEADAYREAMRRFSETDVFPARRAALNKCLPGVLESTWKPVVRKWLAALVASAVAQREVSQVADRLDRADLYTDPFPFHLTRVNVIEGAVKDAAASGYLTPPEAVELLARLA